MPRLVTLEAISLDYPYVGWVWDGSKPFETRRWRPYNKGPLVICSTKRKVSDDDGPHGVALCIVDVGTVRPMTPSDEELARIPYDPKLYVWELENVRRFEQPFAIKGGQKIFRRTIDLDKLTSHDAAILERTEGLVLF